MKQDLTLFYQMWGLNSPDARNIISAKKLNFFTKYELCQVDGAQKMQNHKIINIAIVIVMYFIFIPLGILFTGAYILHLIFVRLKRTKTIAKMQSGIFAYNSQDYNTALDVFLEIQHYIKSDYELNSWIFECYFNLGLYNEAFTFIGKFPTPDYRMKQLRCYQKFGNLQFIVDCINTQYFSLEINTRPTLLAILGTALLKMNYPDIAKNKLSKYHAIFKEMTEEQCALTYTLAKCEEALGHIDKARALYRKISAFNPSFMDTDEILKKL